MGLLIFLLTACALVILTIPFLKKEQFIIGTYCVIFISSLIVSANSTYFTCQDNWSSHSIGRQGACSWHGGVVTRLNDFGWVVLVVSIIIIGVACLYILYKEKRQKRKEIKNKV